MFNNTSSCRVKLGIIVRVEHQQLKIHAQRDITALQIPDTQLRVQKETTARDQLQLVHRAHQHQFHAKQGFTALLYLKITVSAWRGTIALQVHLHKFRVQETHIQPLNHQSVRA